MTSIEFVVVTSSSTCVVDFAKLAVISQASAGKNVKERSDEDFGKLKIVFAMSPAFVLGPEAPAEWRGMDLAAHSVIGRVGGRLEREGRGSNVLGDPRIALAWLANELSRHGVTLAAGQVVTTGTCVVPPPFAPGDRVRADFGVLGSVDIQMGR